MKELTPPAYIIEMFQREQIVTDSVFLYWKGCLKSLLDINSNRYSIAELVDMVKIELDKSQSKMFKSQAIKMINL